MGKCIRVNFVDFWDGFVPEESLFYRTLLKKYEVQVDEKDPEYVFYSVFGYKHLKYDCIKIFYTGENQMPDFNICDYAFGFDYIELGDRYFRLPNYYLYKSDFEAMDAKTYFTAVNIKAKDGFCSFVYSNNNSSPERNLFFDRLSEYKQVDSGGRFRNNIGYPVGDKVQFQAHYKFSIAFENCTHPGYTTEKLVQSFASQTIPIYWGNPLVGRDFNTQAFVNCHDFNSWSDVIEAIKRIDADDELYLKMMRTPALVSEDKGYDATIERMEQFLFHIIDQDIKTAGRYSRHYWGQRHIELERTKQRIYDLSLRGIAESIYKKTLWKWRRNSRALWKLDRAVKKK